MPGIDPIVLYEAKDQIARVSLNRPKQRNAFNSQMYREMYECMQECLARDDASCATASPACWAKNTRTQWRLWSPTPRALMSRSISPNRFSGGLTGVSPTVFFLSPDRGRASTPKCPA